MPIFVHFGHFATWHPENGHFATLAPRKWAFCYLSLLKIAKNLYHNNNISPTSSFTLKNQKISGPHASVSGTTGSSQETKLSNLSNLT